MLRHSLDTLEGEYPFLPILALSFFVFGILISALGPNVKHRFDALTFCIFYLETVFDNVRIQSNFVAKTFFANYLLTSRCEENKPSPGCSNIEYHLRVGFLGVIFIFYVKII